MDKNTTGEAKSRGIPNRGILYSKIALKSDKLLNTLFELLDHKNENVRLGAAKTLLNKIIPDVKNDLEVEALDEANKPVEHEISSGLLSSYVELLVVKPSKVLTEEEKKLFMVIGDKLRQEAAIN